MGCKRVKDVYSVENFLPTPHFQLPTALIQNRKNSSPFDVNSFAARGICIGHKGRDRHAFKNS